MQTPLDENVLRHFREQREKIDGKPAVIGRLGAAGVVDVSQDPRVDGNPNRLYAVIGGNRAETAVWNTGKFIVNWRYPGMNVRVALNGEGEWEIIAGDARAADRVFGRAAGQVLSPPQTIPELNESPVPGRNLLPGRVRSWVSGTLEVNAEEFPYTDSAGSEKLWQPTTVNTLDLSTSVPASVSSIDQHRYVKIALNPDATTPVLVAFAGTAQAVTLPLSRAGWTDIAITDGYVQLDTVILRTGDTDETDIPESDWRYTRRVQETAIPSSSLPNFGTGATKTLSSGVASAGSDRHLVLAAESSTTDDLIEVSGLSVGDAVLLRADSGDTITVKHNDAGATDKIILSGGADLALSGDDLLLVVKTASGKVVQPVDEQGSGSGGATAILHFEELASAGIFDIDLSAISGGLDYHDLEITALLRSTVSGTSGDAPYLFWNADDTASNYSFTRMRADYTSVIQEDGSTPIVGFANSAGDTSTYFATVVIKILNYGGGQLKAAMYEATYYTGSVLYRWSGVHQWSSAAVITRLRLQPDGYPTHEWAADSRITVMGINPI